MDTIIVRSLWATRRSDRDQIPELLEAWDEYCQDANPDGAAQSFQAALAAMKDDLDEFRYVLLAVPTTLVSGDGDGPLARTPHAEISVRTIWVTRRSEPGSTPELICAWDERSIEENYDGFQEAVTRAIGRIGDDLLDVRTVDLMVSERTVWGAFEPARETVRGAIDPGAYEQARALGQEIA